MTVNYGSNVDDGEEESAICLQKPSLTQREKEILLLDDKGYTRQKMAEKLCISIRSIDYHTHNIYKKFEVCRLRKAYLIARQMGLI